MVAAFGRPHGDERDVAGLGGAVGQLAETLVDFGGAYRYAGAIQPEIHRGGGCRGGLLGAGTLHRLGAAEALVVLARNLVSPRGRSQASGI